MEKNCNGIFDQKRKRGRKGEKRKREYMGGNTEGKNQIQKCTEE